MGGGGHDHDRGGGYSRRDGQEKRGAAGYAHGGRGGADGRGQGGGYVDDLVNRMDGLAPFRPQWRKLPHSGQEYSGFWFKERKSCGYRWLLEMAVPNADRRLNDHKYILFVLFNPPDDGRGDTIVPAAKGTITRLIDIMFGEKVFGHLGHVDGFKIVNLFSEIQTDPKNIDVFDSKSIVDPEEWRHLCTDHRCLAIVAGWGEIGEDEENVRKHKEVRKRRIRVAEFLNQNHPEKVGTLGTSRAGYPYHPNSDVFRRGLVPKFNVDELPEK